VVHRNITQTQTYFICVSGSIVMFALFGVLLLIPIQSYAQVREVNPNQPEIRPPIFSMGYGQLRGGLGIAGELPLSNPVAVVIGGGLFFATVDVGGETLTINTAMVDACVKAYITDPSRGGLGGLWIGAGYGGIGAQKQRYMSGGSSREEQKVLWSPFALAGVDVPIGENLLFTGSFGFFFENKVKFFEGTAFEEDYEFSPPITLDLGIGIRL
jgi:hypothetical protein